MHLACSDWSILNSNGGFWFDQWYTMSIKSEAGHVGQRPSIRTVSFWRVQSMERGISCWIVSELTHAVSMTHILWVIIHNSSLLTHYEIVKRPSFHFWFVFCDLLRNSLPPFSIFSSIRMENDLYKVKNIFYFKIYSVIHISCNLFWFFVVFSSASFFLQGRNSTERQYRDLGDVNKTLENYRS